MILHIMHLKTLLKSSWFYIFLFIITISSIFISVKVIKYESIYNIEDNSFIGTIEDFYIDGNYLSIRIKAKENLRGFYYFKEEKEKRIFIDNYKYGDKIKINGILTAPLNNTNPNLFNYKEYLYRQREFYTLNIETITKLEDNKNIVLNIKNFIMDRINNLKSGSYINTFILGSNRAIDSSINDNYRDLGISHLFSISGMHINLFSLILLNLLKPLKNKRYLIVILFLIFYLFLTNFIASAFRAIILFVMITINKLLKLDISSIKLCLLTISLILFINPFIIYNIGFLFSSIITMFLITFKDKLNSNDNYFMKLLKTSYIAFLASFPIVIYSFYSINLLTIFYNLIFVPMISFIIFPLSLLTFIFPMLDNLLYLSIYIMEYLASLLSSTSISLILMKPSLVVCILYYILIFLSLKYNKMLIIFMIVILFHYNYNYFIKSNYLLMIDINQGDSILLHSNNSNILIDTGGKQLLEVEEWKKMEKNSNYAENTLIPIFKSLGIRKLDYLVLTHGDNDHLGEAINLINNYNIEKVLFNADNFNTNELKIIDLLNYKKIEYYKLNAKANIKAGNYLLQSINNVYGNENDSSVVILANIFKYKILLTGDISKGTERHIINKYDIGNIDILKVAHHGSKTSTSEELIRSVNPTIALISVGRNNKYNHPSSETIEMLNTYDIDTYMTSTMGSILINFKKDVTIDTLPP